MNFSAHLRADLHLDAKIGPGLMLPHPIGVVVGGGCRIGRNKTLYQNVTIGRNVRSGDYPDIGDHVVTHPDAVIIGGISIGNGAVVGAGSVVRADVAADTVVAGNPARMLRATTTPDRVDRVDTSLR